MLELKNVSKFYYNKTTVSSGFSKINLKLDLGEFVAITGESGSGKSTLLNVISGLDSYEEGEMYINGEETSGYTEKDFENYRKKYIANIFQNFNLVNSYTVYQNVELVLLINGYKKHEIKEKILETLEKVDLLKYKNMKVSKLSGGQKQRVAIARALVKETPIIVADEPTGNLDVKTANNIIELLKEVAKDKLIIIVTHNYEQVEKYATRKITMSDGRIIEDKKIERDNKNIQLKENTFKMLPNENKGLRLINKILLGIRNTFNIKTKFLLLLAVYLFVCISIAFGYSALQSLEYEESNSGYNNFFRDLNPKRIIIKKNDLSAITDEDYKKLENIENVDYIVKNDVLIDGYLIMMLDNSAMSAQANSITNFNEEITFGRKPEKENEVLIQVAKDSYMAKKIEESVGKSTSLINMQNSSKILDNNVEIVGVSIVEQDDFGQSYGRARLYLEDNNLNEIRKNLNIGYAKTTIEFYNQILEERYSVMPNANVPEGEAFVPESFKYMTKNNNCINEIVNVNIETLYYKDNMNVKISKTYNEKNMKRLLNIEDYNRFSSTVFVNPQEYAKLFDKENYQSSIYMKDDKLVSETIEELQNNGYTTLHIKDAIINSMGESMVFINIFRIVLASIVAIVLFFISYFIIKIIMKSRNIYFSTVRILGATKKNLKELLQIELFTMLNIAYVITILIIILIQKEIINIQFLKNIIEYIKITDLLVIYIILLIMSKLISLRYSKQLFKKSAMNTYREEV